MNIFGVDIHHHIFGEWETHPDKQCTKICRCKKEGCTKTKEKVEHNFGLPKYEANNKDYCVEIKRCKICGYETRKEIEHNFREYKFHTEDCCSQSSQCVRCNYVDTTKVSHNFGQGELLPYQCMVKKICKKCGSIEYSCTKHLWTGTMSYKKCFTDVIEAKLDRRSELNRILDRPSEHKNYKLLAEIDAINDELAFLNQSLSNAKENQFGRYCTHCLQIEYLGKKENIAYPKGFLSYSWKNQDMADSVYSILKEQGVQILRDSCNLNSGEDIREFMEQIKTVDFVVMIITPDYLESVNCMFEGVQATQVPPIRKKRILPIVCKKDCISFENLKNLEAQFFTQQKNFIENGDENKNNLCKIVINDLKNFLNEVHRIKYMDIETVQQISEHDIINFINNIKKEYGMK